MPELRSPFLRVPARALLPGDRLVPTGRVVLTAPEAGLRTPRGRVELTLARHDGTPEPGYRCWHGRTIVTILRSEDAGSSIQSSDRRMHGPS